MEAERQDEGQPTPLQGLWSQALVQLERDLATRDSSARTLRAYRTDVAQFAAWAGEQGLTPQDVGPRAVRRYIARLSQEGYAPSTSARKLAALRALFASQREHGQITQNPADLVSTPRRSDHLPRVLSARDAARLLDGIPASGPLELRDRAMFELAYSCGLRAEELVALRVQDVDHDGEQVRVEGKGRKTRFVPVGEPALLAVASYLERARAGAFRLRGPRERVGRALPLTDGPAARHQRRPAAAADVDEPGRSGRGVLAARAAPQLRHAPARRRRGPAEHPGDARPCECVQHPDLHSGRVLQANQRLRAQSPSGLNGERRPWRPTSNRSSCANSGGATRTTATAASASGWSSPTRRWSSTWPGAPPPGCLRTSRRPT